MAYFRKYDPAKAPPLIERVNNGDVYVVTLYYDDLKRGGLRDPAEFAVLVTRDGSVRPLRQRDVEYKEIRSKKRGAGYRAGPNTFTIARSVWRVDPFWSQAAREKGKDVAEFLTETFVMAVNFFAVGAVGGMTRVDVSRDGLHAIFSVDPARTSYFFKDRKMNVTKNGSRRRIFHIVSPHERKRGDRKVGVKMHFRGERRFEWNGYSVAISIPGRHHIDVAEFGVGAVDLDFEDRRHEYATMREMAAHLRSAISKEAA
jgi:hypothetical protein